MAYFTTYEEPSLVYEMVSSLELSARLPPSIPGAGSGAPSSASRAETSVKVPSSKGCGGGSGRLHSVSPPPPHEMARLPTKPSEKHANGNRRWLIATLQ